MSGALPHAGVGIVPDRELRLCMCLCAISMGLAACGGGTSNQGGGQNESTFDLAVTMSGAGTGTVTGGEISCSSGSASGCTSTETAGSTVTLTAAAGSGSTFGGWSGGGCSGTGATCVVTMSANETVTVTFTLPNPLQTCPEATTPPAGLNPISIAAASTGDDITGDGSCQKPYMTITAALAAPAVTSGTVVWVAPGNYTAALGEVFPIQLPAGVSLVGDETNKGQGAIATSVVGGTAIGGSGQYQNYEATIFPSANSVIAGLELTNPSLSVYGNTLLLLNDSVTIRNNSVVNGEDGIFVGNGASGEITGNNISNNGGDGLAFIGGGVGSKVEGNTIVRNGIGVEYDNSGGDLGGGPAGSAGGNSLSCNTRNDLWTDASGITINAANNYWDHIPPTAGAVNGDDIYNTKSATIVTTGAMLAINPCP